MERKSATQQDIRYDSRGLVPAVVQDSATREVLMVAWMNQQALQLTVETGEAHYWSRSRQELWHKGATSGNTQKMREMYLDCDGDTLLLKVEPAGPACHTGAVSCFYRQLGSAGKYPDEGTKPSREKAEPGTQDRGISDGLIDELYWVLLDRKRQPSPNSYTSALLSDEEEIAKKIGEEAIEVILAAASQGRERLVEESADLIYHLLVLLVANDLTWEDVLSELARRRR